MIYNDLVAIIGTVPEGYEWIYAIVSGFILCMYVYTFVNIFVGLFKTMSRGRY